jgi:glycosyltransferase involved in cell wall biosynthesis
MRFHLVHIVSSLEKINFGIWNAAVFGSSHLLKNYQIATHLWVTDARQHPSIAPNSIRVQYLKHHKVNDLKKLAVSSGITAEKSIFITHGAWLRPTKIGFMMHEAGYKWLYVPHGMLEKWSLRQGALKKQIYYHFLEKRWVKRADAVKAVSEAEQKNLERRLRRKVSLVENGVKVEPLVSKATHPEIYLFMGRLHHKKGVLPLVKAWKNVLEGMPQKKLVIAGPDEGELEKVQPFINGNIEYVGAVYGEAKSALLKRANYFVLPSYSEGFPTTVLEAMNFGAVPLISKGCNFSQVFQHGLGYNIEPDEESISRIFRTLRDEPFDAELSKRNHDFIAANYSEERIGERLYRLYTSVLNEKETVSHVEVLQ